MRVLLLVPIFHGLLIGTNFGQEYPSNLFRDLKSPSSLKTAIDSLIIQEMEKERLPGAAFIMVHKGRIIHAEGYGVTDVDTQIPVNVDSALFRIGSITKFITALGLLKLVNENEIGLDDEVNQYLDELELLSDYDDPVRIWHLITHTGGFDQKLRGRLYPDQENRPSIASFLHGELIQVKPPGSLGSYDTYGITLAGRIIEKVSGLSYEQYISENILKVVDMNLSGIEMGDRLTHLLAKGYGLHADGYIPQKYEYYTTTPASSMDGTTSDMRKLLKAILERNNDLLSSNLWREILSNPQFRNAPEIPGFSYGLWEKFQGNERVLWHGGIMNGYTSTMYLIPEHNLGFYLVYTRDFETGPNPNLRNILPNYLLERWFPVSTVTLPEKITINTKRFEGTYANTIYCRMCFEGEGASRRIYSIESTGEGTLTFLGTPFYAYSPLNFTDSTGRFKLGFRENDSGQITYVFGGWSADATYEKLGAPLIQETQKSGFNKTQMSPFKAMTFRGMGAWAEAAEVYEEITKNRPQDGRAQHYLGLCLSNANQSDEAINALNKAYELGQWKRFTARMIAELYLAKNELPKTYEWLKVVKNDAMESGMSEQKVRDFILMSPSLKGLKDHPVFKETFNSERE